MSEPEITTAPAEPEKSRATRCSSGGSVYKRPNSPYWWIHYGFNGRVFRESSKSTLKGTAQTLLRRRLEELERRGKLIGPTIERTTYADLEKLLLADVGANRRPNYLAS